MPHVSDKPRKPTLEEATQEVARLKEALRETRGLLRTEGDAFQRLRRENEHKRESWREDGMKRTAAPFSDMCDGLRVALDEARTPTTSPELAQLLSGVELIRRNFAEVLSRLGVGIEEFSSLPTAHTTRAHAPGPPSPLKPAVSRSAPVVREASAVAAEAAPPAPARESKRPARTPRQAPPRPEPSQYDRSVAYTGYTAHASNLMTPSYIDLTGVGSQPEEVNEPAKRSSTLVLRDWVGSLVLPPIALIYGANLGEIAMPEYFAGSVRGLSAGAMAKVFQLLVPNPEVLSLLGGCLLQIALPAFVLWYLLRHEHMIAAQVAGVWLAQNFINLSIWVMGRAPGLPALEEPPGLRHAMLDLFGVGHHIMPVSSGLFVLGFTVFATMMLLPFQRVTLREMNIG